MKNVFVYFVGLTLGIQFGKEIVKMSKKSKK
jgi:hypothetical protein